MNKIAFFIISTLVFVLWLLWVSQSYILIYFDVTWKTDDRGLWGDTFGALNALFAAIAFIAVLYTIKLQQSQIYQSQHEQSKQKFERNFFQLLQMLREERESINIQANHTNRTFENTEKTINGYLAIHNYINKKTNKEQIVKIYNLHVDSYAEKLFSTYFRLIYTILKFIHEDKYINNEEKIRYGNIVRDQLSHAEVAIIMIAGLRPIAHDMNIYLIEFRIARYLNNSPIRTSLCLNYPAETFQARDD